MQIGFFLEVNNTNLIMYDLINYQRDVFRDVCIITLEEGDGELASICRRNGIKWYGIKERRFVRRIIAVHNLCKREKIEALYINGYMLSKFILPLRLLSPNLYLVLIRHHNKVHHLSHAKRAISIDKLAGKFSHSVIAVSESTKRTLVEEGTVEDKISVIYNGVDSERFITYRSPNFGTEKQRKWKLLALGRIVWEKNYEAMIQAMCELAKRGIDFQLDIYGNGSISDVENLESQIRDSKLGEKVFVRRFSYDIPNILKNSDILVHTAVDESLGMAIVEGYLSGIPIVSNTPAGVREISTIVGDTLTEKNLDLVDKIHLVISDFTSFISIARAYQRRAQSTFDISEMGERYLKHFESTKKNLMQAKIRQ